MTDGASLRLAVARPDRAPAAAAARAARATGADLLILPRSADMSTEASDGALAERLGELAAAEHLAILFAYLEACSGCTYLALQLVLADGRSTANYRTTHVGAAGRTAGWTPGNWLTMTRLEPLTLGLMAGLDHLAPEVGRALSARGAEALIAVADTASEATSEAHADVVGAGGLSAPLARLRALENGIPCCIIGADGVTHAAAADGTPRAVERHAELDCVTLTKDGRARAMPRRPDLYHQLVEPIDDPAG